jgi:hypothetical protein
MHLPIPTLRGGTGQARAPSQLPMFVHRNLGEYRHCCRRFCVEKAFAFNQSQQPQQAIRNRFNTNQLRTSKFNSFQQALESGSGPGGQTLKSSLPDHLFSSRIERVAEQTTGIGNT